MRSRFLMKLLVLAICAFVIALPASTFAHEGEVHEDEAAETTEEPPAGVGLGILVVGVVAVGGVGLLMISRENFQGKEL
jgi:hypothetical protein